MSRLDKKRQAELEPKRMNEAKKRIEHLGFEVRRVSETELNFEYNGSTIYFFPYSGWASGATIKDGRGLRTLLKQLK